MVQDQQRVGDGQGHLDSGVAKAIPPELPRSMARMVSMSGMDVFMPSRKNGISRWRSGIEHTTPGKPDLDGLGPGGYPERKHRT